MTDINNNKNQQSEKEDEILLDYDDDFLDRIESIANKLGITPNEYIERIATDHATHSGESPT